MSSFRTLIFQSAHAFGLHHLLRRSRPARPTVLGFHRIAEDIPFWMSMPPAVFDRLIGYCTRHFEIVPVMELTQSTSGPSNKPRLALTFDDGYDDFYTDALPILKEHGVTANVNIITDCTDHGRPLWTRQLAEAFESLKTHRVRHYAFDGIALQLTGKWLHDFNAQLHTMMAWKPEQRTSFFEQVQGKYGTQTSPRFMDWEQLRAVKAQGIEIGSHTVSHAILTELSEEDARSELRDSKALIDRQLNQDTRVFAFPNAVYNASLLSGATDAGYQLSLLGDNATPGTPDALPRTMLYPESYEESIFRLEDLHNRMARR